MTYTNALPGLQDLKAAGARSFVQSHTSVNLALGVLDSSLCLRWIVGHMTQLNLGLLMQASATQLHEAALLSRVIFDWLPSDTRQCSSADNLTTYFTRA